VKLAGAIFDLDGTIADTFAICFATFRNTLAHVAGPALTDAEIRAAFGPNHARLVAVKSRYDPTNFFRVNQNIVPAEPMAI